MGSTEGLVQFAASYSFSHLFICSLQFESNHVYDSKGNEAFKLTSHQLAPNLVNENMQNWSSKPPNTANPPKP